MPNLTSRLITLLLACIATLSTIGLIACYLDRGWLNSQSAANLAQIFGSLAVGISLVFIAKQVQLQTQLARGANSQSLVNVCSNFVLAVGCSDNLMELYATGGERFESLTDTQKAQYRYLVTWWLTFYENVVYQNSIGLLDEGVYEAWLNDMTGFITRRHVDKVWDTVKGNYSKQFVSTFEKLLNERVPAANTSPDTAKKTS
jgi:hypothetical protein